MNNGRFGFCSMCRRRRRDLVVVRQGGAQVAVCRDCLPHSEQAILERLIETCWRAERIGEILPRVCVELAEVAR